MELKFEVEIAHVLILDLHKALVAGFLADKKPMLPQWAVTRKPPPLNHAIKKARGPLAARAFGFFDDGTLPVICPPGQLQILTKRQPRKSDKLKPLFAKSAAGMRKPAAGLTVRAV